MKNFLGHLFITWCPSSSSPICCRKLGMSGNLKFYYIWERKFVDEKCHVVCQNLGFLFSSHWHTIYVLGGRKKLSSCQWNTKPDSNWLQQAFRSQHRWDRSASWHSIAHSMFQRFFFVVNFCCILATSKH